MLIGNLCTLITEKRWPIQCFGEIFRHILDTYTRCGIINVQFFWSLVQLPVINDDKVLDLEQMVT